MNFSEYRRTLKIEEIGIVNIDYDNIHCQYNPDLINKYLSVADSLKLSDSPHYKFLKGDEKPYTEMYRGYGRTEQWIDKKITEFSLLIINIIDYGIKEIPEILIKPIISNRYNDSYEIWEGHHRCAIMMFLNLPMKVMLCKAE